MKPNRWPLLVLIPASIVAGVAVDNNERGDIAEEASQPNAAIETPVLQTDSDRAQVWYCSGMTSGVEGAAQGAIVLSNTSSSDRVAVITAYSSSDTLDDLPVISQIELPIASRVNFRMAQLIDRPGYTAATIEIDGAGVLVERSMVGLGVDRQPCATSTSTSWFDPIGSTLSPDGREVLVLFNPFAADAVVDLRFSTDLGERIPEDGVGLVVRGHSVVKFEVTERVTEADIVSTSLTVRSGQVVLDRLQTFDGTGDLGREGLSSGTAAPAAADAWYFPHFSLSEHRQELLVVYNPTAERAEVDIEVYPQAGAGVVIPFERSILPGQRVVIDLSQSPQLAEAGVTDFSSIVLSANGVNIVAGRFLALLPSEVEAPVGSGEVVMPSIGVAAQLGAVRPARSFMVDVEPPDSSIGSKLVVFNPSIDSIVNVDIVVPQTGSRIATLEVAPRGFSMYSLDEVGEPTVLQLDATGDVVVGREFAGLTSRSIALGVPIDSNSEPNR